MPLSRLPASLAVGPESLAPPAGHAGACRGRQERLFFLVDMRGETPVFSCLTRSRPELWGLTWGGRDPHGETDLEPGAG